MAEVYPMVGPGKWAGSYCNVKACTRYGRFLLTPYNSSQEGKVFCGQHLTAGIRGLTVLEQKAVVIQQVPGNWGKELVVFEGKVVTLPPADRKR